jgi:hypothetical protein
MRRRAGLSLVFVMGALVAAITSALALPAAGAASDRHDDDRSRSYFVYWDQNEEQDFLAMPSRRLGQLIPPYDPNGQMCVLPGGRFVTGYNPTLTSQHNPGSLKPTMQPPVGEALWDRHGRFTGTTLFVPGPYKLPGQSVGGDIPPDPNRDTFNGNGTFTGCAVDRHANVFAVDLGTAQGQFPPPDNGRLIEWFAPSYTTFCIVDGPTSGGVGPHHVDGAGGLTQPGDLAFDENGDLLVPVAGDATVGLFSGRVLRFEHTSLPRRAADCGPNGLYPRDKLRTSVFIQGSLSLLPFPESIARDPACECWAVASVIGDPAIAFFDDHGKPLPSMGSIHGETISNVGQDPNGINPYGIAFAPDGTLYIADIHIRCSAPLVGCGPAPNGGRVLEVAYKGGRPGVPRVVAGGYNFPTSVTVCDPHRRRCPTPLGSGGHDD